MRNEFEPAASESEGESLGLSKGYGWHSVVYPTQPVPQHLFTLPTTFSSYFQIIQNGLDGVKAHAALELFVTVPFHLWA